MKNLLIILISLTLLVQCKKEDVENVTDIVNVTASMTAKLNGVSWKAVTRYTTKQSGNFVITGTASGGNDIIAITVLGETEGTYKIDPLQAQVQFTANYTPVATSSDSIFTATEGTVVISKIDAVNKKISGTFSFKMNHVNNPLNVGNVTEGAFSNLNYNE